MQIAHSSQYIDNYLNATERNALFDVVANAPYNVYEYARLEKWIGTSRSAQACTKDGMVHRLGRLSPYISTVGDRATKLHNVRARRQPDAANHAGGVVDKVKRDFGETVYHAIAIYYHARRRRPACASPHPPYT